jgi:DNA-directed RNA polymerase subunit RPC12/RpoP
MKKLLFVLMLLIFPLHVSWAAVDTYCAQEQVVNSYQCIDCGEEVAAGVKGAPSGTDKSSLNCDFCSVSTPAIATFQISFSPSSSVALKPVVRAAYFLSVEPPQPERPQWLSLFT